MLSHMEAVVKIDKAWSKLVAALDVKNLDITTCTLPLCCLNLPGAILKAQLAEVQAQAVAFQAQQLA
jgi:hypothetical protein